jgi:hypothetical protein
MRWIGQNIYDLISRFRSDVYLEDISAGTIADGGNLGLDTAGKIVKADVLEGDLTSIIAGTGLSGTSLTGPIPTLNVDASIPSITTLAGLTSFGAAGVTTGIVAGDVTMYNAVNDGNPTISLGSSATNRLEMVSTYNSGAQTLDSVSFNSYTTSGAVNDGRYFWRVDENQLMALLDAGLTVYGNVFAGADGASITSQNTTASSATEGGKLVLRCDDGAAMADNHRLGVVEFSGAEDASNNRQTGARIQAMCDAGWSASENGTRLEFYTMDGNASSELSLTLDSDLLATFAGAATITGLTTLSGNLTFDSVALTAVQTSAESFADNDTSLMTSAAINDAIIKGGSATIIKVLPRDFMANEDGGVNKSILYDDTGTIGVRTSSDNSELYAFVEIPVGKTATSVIVYGNDTNNVVEVFEANINASGLADKTPGAGCVVGTACDITDVAADATNYLAIRVTTTTAASDIVYGAAVTISG